MPSVSSAAGLLALLEEDSDDLKSYALKNLNNVCHDYWFQISGAISAVEALYEDENFAHRDLAALVASKVFYHLGELDDALNYALGAGQLFNVLDPSEYVQTLVARCLDQYFELRTKQVESKDKEVVIDERLTSIVERMIDRCCEQGQYEQAVGVALEGRRLDKLEAVISSSPHTTRILKYSLRVCQQLVVNRDFRQQVLRLLIRQYEGVASPDWVDICQCLMFLDDAAEVAIILNRLLLGSEDDALLAYQVGFDLVENELQNFLIKVQSHIAGLAPRAAGADAVDGVAPDEAVAAAALAALAAGGAAASEATAMDAEGGALEPLLAAGAGAPEPHGEQYTTRHNRLTDILSGKTPIGLYLDFLYRHNHSDLQILKNIKAVVDSRNSVCHSATILANSYMHAGTTIDTFLRDNLDWLSRATNWAKFSATAGLGVIHRGHLQQGRALMAPYLPRNGQSGSPFSEGGALYALGLIYANHGQDVRTFLLESLRATSNEVTQHGACLGLGLANLGTEDEEVLEDIKNILYTDSAVAGEAAGIGMGLLLAGSASDKAQEMLAYAHDTQHEKIIRGVSIGLALLMYGREEGAETLIEQMTRDQDPIIRYGGMYVIGLAYRGTGNNAAVEKLLHFAVSDVSDDVRRAAVLCLGFVLMGAPEQCPRTVALLAESFNPHVRYGSAMAVGMACAGSGLKEAVALLEPMLLDAVDFVRQGALIALALVLVQQPEARLAPFRKRLDKFINDKHEEVMCKMGAIMAAGIIDAGGRNVTIGLRSRSGYFRRTSVIGLAVFTQHWYWYPLTYFLSLAFQPTALIGLNASLEMPKFSVTSNCRPSMFAYPPPITTEAKEQLSKVPTAILSTTNKARERARKKAESEQKKSGAAVGSITAAAAAATADGSAAKPATSSGSRPSAAGDAKAAAGGPTAMESEETSSAAAGKEGEAAKPKVVEASTHTLENPSRVVPGQLQYIVFDKDARFVPVKQDVPSGIMVLRDRQPGEPIELVTTQAAAAAAAAAGTAAPAAAAPAGGAPAAAAASAEPAPPAPFEYVP